MLNKYADQVVSARAKINMSVQKLKETFTPDLESSQQVLATKYEDAKFNAKVVVLLGASAISGLFLLSVALLGASSVALAAQGVTDMLYSVASSLIIPVISGTGVYLAKARIEYKLAEKREAKINNSIVAEVTPDTAPDVAVVTTEVNPEIEMVTNGATPSETNEISPTVEPNPEATLVEESGIKKNFSDTGFEIVSETDGSVVLTTTATPIEDQSDLVPPPSSHRPSMT